MTDQPARRGGPVEDAIPTMPPHQEGGVMNAKITLLPFSGALLLGARRPCAQFSAMSRALSVQDATCGTPATTGGMKIGWPEVLRRLDLADGGIDADELALVGGEPQPVAGQHRPGPRHAARQLAGPQDLALAAGNGHQLPAGVDTNTVSPATHGA